MQPTGESILASAKFCLAQEDVSQQISQAVSTDTED
jgi:hypothetical protein